MALTLEEALEQLGELKGKVKPLEAERDRLLTHKGELESDLAKAKSGKQEAESKVAELTDKVPQDGSRVLSKAEAERFDAFAALNLKPDEIKTNLEQASQDRQALTTAGNKEALQTLGLKPSALRLREFDGAVITAKKDGDKVTATVKVGDTETPYEQFVKDKGLEGDLKDFALQQPGVVVVPQHAGGGGTVGNPTGKLVDNLNAARESRPNPLLKGNTDGNKNQVLP